MAGLVASARAAAGADGQRRLGHDALALLREELLALLALTEEPPDSAPDPR